MPKSIIKWGISLAFVRLLLFLFVYFNQSTDAQWQLSYLPFWLIDFPISIIYFFVPLPIPLAEGVIGTIWWFFLPIIYWKIMAWLKRAKGT